MDNDIVASARTRITLIVGAGVSVGILIGAGLAALLCYRDGFETASWLITVIFAPAATIFAIAAFLWAWENHKSQTGTSPPAASRAGRSLPWWRRPAATAGFSGLAAALAMVVGVGFIEREKPDQRTEGSEATARSGQTTSSTSPGAVPGPREPAALGVSATDVPPGDSLNVDGGNFRPGEIVKIELFEGADLKHFDGLYEIGSPTADGNGRISTRVTIPDEICCAGATVRLVIAGSQSHRRAEEIITLK